MRISTNLTAINAQNNLKKSGRDIETGLSQLASGSRINKSSDDAAGLAISERLKGQIRSVSQASRNANDGISMVQTAEGGLNEIGVMLIRIRELSLQSASDSLPATERTFIQKEVEQLKNEISRISEVTTWGSTKLLDGSTESFDFQVGIFNDAFEDRIQFKAGQNSASLEAFGISDVSVSSKLSARRTIGKIDTAQNHNNAMRANLGAIQNRLVSTVNNLEVAHENMSASNSRIRDTDIAQVTSDVARNNILQKASTATLSQANVMPSMAMQLING